MTATTPSVDEWRAAMSHLEAFIELPEAERAARLEELQRTDPVVAQLVERMLRADHDAETGDLDSAAEAAEDLQATLVGRRLGAWRIDRLVGTGGMGHVWLAHRTDGLYDGSAAIKLLRHASLDPAAGQRFAREGQLLGRLSHPHIARLLDAGITSDGSRYLVLEYVDGARIDEWCDARRLGVEQRIRLFLGVCEAVAYAHRALVVHRDLKPSNIFVDGEGHVKLLDFGVAKLLSQEVEGDITREAGGALTPQYAAPEQFTNGTITTATDVFGLGMVLYGLLSGTRPWVQSVSPLDTPMLTSPPQPLWTLQLTPLEAQQVAALRGTSVESLRRTLRGDVAAVVAKAIRVDAEDRYASVSDLIDDLQRVLESSPVRARPDGTLYRARRYIRRHALGLSAAALVIGAIAVGATTTWMQQRAALREAQHAADIKTFLLKMFEEARSSVNGTGAAREASLDDMLRAGAARVGDYFKAQPETRDEVYQMLVELTADTGDEARTTDLARARLAAVQAAFGPEDRRTASAEIMLGGVLLNFGHLPEAQAALAHAEQVLERARDTESLERAQLWRWQGIALLLSRKEYHWKDQPLLRSVDLLQKRFPGSDELLSTLTSLPMAACRAGEPDEALHWARTLGEQATAKYGPTGLYAIDARMNEATVMQRAGKAGLAAEQLEKLIVEYERALGPDHPNTLTARFQLAASYFLADRPAEGEAALAAADGLLVKSHPDDERLKGFRANVMTKIQRHKEGKSARCGA